MYIRSNKRKLQAIETKNRIFDIAHTMFRERGFYNVTVEEIADAANISVGALYHHFKNKYELLTAWHDRLDEQYAKYYINIKNDPHFANATAPEIIKEMLLYIQETCINYGTEYISVIYSYLLSNTEFATIMTDMGREYYKIMTELMEKGQDEGTIRKDIPVAQLVHDLTIVSRGCLTDWAIEHSNKRMRDFSKSVLDSFLRGIAA
ncbi:TetR/AcrR family transcriptional regulator [Cloacibacillus evryensis]|uniref:TetR/AcrR family transcriptional regulator n=1 Tax=Cloacibacillus evryensis TaxID=508460 RepID=UPI000447AB93|nr:TetR/AcrR family transcriptional regulator [Cloacibacillus evryensis]EXG78570.1 transcriptional regulator [Cloacibacillus evryensis DSM 19522]MCQ4765143.1 TetR/AcrR family transcriptional regulator [Cloacibacillus evryensis]